MKALAMVLGALFASTAFAGTYNDTTANNSFAAAVNLNPYFSNGYSPDVGDASGANTSRSAPWVTVSGRSNGAGLWDYYKFTTYTSGRVIVDIDYTMGYTNGFDSWLNFYNAAGTRIAYNDDGGTVAGAGGSIHGYDSFLQFNSLAAGTYYIQVGRFSNSPLDANRQYTMQVQAPVPEPETYAMLLAGLAVLGRVVRRKKQAA